MESLYFGLAAALCWGVHDVCVRYVSQRVNVAAAMTVVLATGLVALLPFSLAEAAALPARSAALAGLAGLAFAGGTYSLYRAFAIGPLRLVAPIIGAYPILSLLWAAATGTPPTMLQWLAAATIVGGIALIAILSDESGTASGGRRAAMIWAGLGGTGFALTFALGQAASGGGGGLSAIFVARAAALAVVAGVVTLSPARGRFLRAPWLLLATMGVLDAAALGLVLLAGGLPHPEFASVASSVFGVVTILLAWAFLRERMTLPQWGGVALVFAGIGYLGL